MIYQLIYHSYASAEFGVDDLLKILIDARISNERREVTGMLLYHDAQFLQLLEGEKTVLKELADQIFDDPRHHTAVRLSFDQVKARDFSGWSMGFANSDENAKHSIRGLHNYFDGKLEWESHVFDPDSAKKINHAIQEFTPTT